MKAATYAALVVATFLVIGKSFAWYITNSLSIKASLVDSLLDAFASMINFVAVRHALKPADADHRFGHGKVEALASLAQSVFIALSSMWLMHEVVERFYNPTTLHYNSWAVVVMIASTVLTAMLIMGQRYVVKRTNSLAVSADALHYQTDILTNLGVLGSFALSSYLHLTYLDTLVGAAIAVYILFASWEILKKSLDILMDRELPDETLAAIRHIVQNHPQVLGIHDLRTRSSGHNEFIQMHLDLEASLTLDQAHHIAEEVANQIYAAFPTAEVIIHQDPVGRCRRRHRKMIFPQ
ncbi:cation diffusion facilitator family transporter [Candidatus Finniella inopinata]|uniref:Protein p34 n=1 Tax=Candidatus Finniella inopinata TaxID=1696036 RepID=A0A4Q7DJ46_9PROT|nr:cation diffusion facilitator family transporter [Candidatus Finniella inopinata]